MATPTAQYFRKIMQMHMDKNKMSIKERTFSPECEMKLTGEWMTEEYLEKMYPRAEDCIKQMKEGAEQMSKCDTKEYTKQEKLAIQEKARKLKKKVRAAEKIKRESWSWDFTISDISMLDVNEIALTLDDVNDKMVAWIIPKPIPIKLKALKPPKKRMTIEEAKEYRRKKYDLIEENKRLATKKAEEVANSTAIVVIHRRIYMKAKEFDVLGSIKINDLPCGHKFIPLANASGIQNVTKWIKEVQALPWPEDNNRAFTVRYPKI